MIVVMLGVAMALDSERERRCEDVVEGGVSNNVRMTDALFVTLARVGGSI